MGIIVLSLQFDAVDAAQRDGGDFFVQRIGPGPGIDCPEMLQRQIAQGDVHGFGGGRRVGAFELEAPSPSIAQQE